jgi:hypothetical protein
MSQDLGGERANLFLLDGEGFVAQGGELVLDDLGVEAVVVLSLALVVRAEGVVVGTNEVEDDAVGVEHWHFNFFALYFS